MRCIVNRVLGLVWMLAGNVMDGTKFCSSQCSELDSWCWRASDCVICLRRHRTDSDSHVETQGMSNSDTFFRWTVEYVYNITSPWVPLYCIALWCFDIIRQHPLDDAVVNKVKHDCNLTENFFIWQLRAGSLDIYTSRSS